MARTKNSTAGTDLKESVTSADIQRRFSTVRAKLAAGPVSITIHGHPRMVIMTHADFQAMKLTSEKANETPS